MTWNKVVVSAPVDSLARRVTSPGHKTTFDPVNRGEATESETPLATFSPDDMLRRTIGAAARIKICKVLRDLTGKRRGRLTCIGMSCDFPKRWIAKCDCGFYVVRTAKALRNKKNDEDCCLACYRAKQLARRRRWKAGLEP
jgi:hypothetical protein